MVGLTSALEGINRSEAQFAQLPPAQPAQSDQVDLSAEAVALIQSKNSFEANTNVLKVADELDRTLMDLMG